MKFDLIDLKAYWLVEFPTIKNLRFVKTILLKKQLNKAIIYRRGLRHINSMNKMLACCSQIF